MEDSPYGPTSRISYSVSLVADYDVMTKHKRKTGECVYCGKIRKLTKDHIPPKNLFAEPRPSDLVTVPCCERCNGKASLDDEYFRIMICPREEVAEHPQASRVLPTTLRALTKPKKKGFRKAFLNSVHEVDLVTPSGLYLGKAGTYDVNLERLSKVAARIVKGLFFYEKGFRLPDRYTAFAYSESSFDWNQSDLQPMLGIWGSLLSIQPCIIANGAFSYRFKFLEDDSNCSIWLQVFYEKVVFIGATCLSR